MLRHVRPRAAATPASLAASEAPITAADGRAGGAQRTRAARSPKASNAACRKSGSPLTATGRRWQKREAIGEVPSDGRSPAMCSRPLASRGGCRVQTARSCAGRMATSRASQPSPQWMMSSARSSSVSPSPARTHESFELIESGDRSFARVEPPLGGRRFDRRFARTRRRRAIGAASADRVDERARKVTVGERALDGSINWRTWY